MPTIRKVTPPVEGLPPLTLSFKQAADYLRSRGYTVTGDGGSMFLVAREQPAEQRLLDRDGVIAKALAEREAQIAADAAALAWARPAPASYRDPHAGWLLKPGAMTAHRWHDEPVQQNGRVRYVAVCGAHTDRKPFEQHLGHHFCRACEVYVEQLDDPFPALPSDLSGWSWVRDLTANRLRLVQPEEGWATAPQPPDHEAACIVEARTIQAREAAAIAEIGVSETPPPSPALLPGSSSDPLPLSFLLTALESHAQSLPYPLPPNHRIPLPLAVPERLAAPLDLIASGRYQPRTKFDEAKLAELADSIREHGILNPLIAFANERGRLELVAGERRLSAARLAELRFVPVEIRSYSLRQIDEISTIDNLQRDDLTPIEEGVAYERMIREWGISEAELARRLSKNRAYIQQRRQLATAAPEIVEALDAGKLTFSQARGICAGAGGDVDAQRVALTKIREEATYRQTTEAEARTYAEKHVQERTEQALKALGWQIGRFYGNKLHIFVYGGGERPAEWTPAQMLTAVEQQRRPGGELPQERPLGEAEKRNLMRAGIEYHTNGFGGWIIAKIGGKPRVLAPDELPALADEAEATIQRLLDRFSAQGWEFHWESGDWSAKSGQGRREGGYGFPKAERLIKQIEAGEMSAAPPSPTEHCARCSTGLYSYSDWEYHQQQKLCKACHAAARQAEAEERAQIRAALPVGCLTLLPDEILYYLALGHQDTDRALFGHRESGEKIADTLARMTRQQQEGTLLSALAWQIWEWRSAPDDYGPGEEGEGDAGEEALVAPIPPDPGADPLQPIRAPLDALERWIGGWQDATPTLAAIAACRARLLEIGGELHALIDDPAISDEEYDAVGTQIGQAETALDALAERGSAPTLEEVEASGPAASSKTTRTAAAAIVVDDGGADG